jgi:hypothetical protein
MPNDLRKIVAVILGLLAAFFAYATLTVPAISATAPAILTIACALGAWFIWPRDSAGAPKGRAATNPSQGYRPCPDCNGWMGRAESLCPHCGSTSTPHVLHAGVWWAKGQSREWQWYDEKARVWRYYKDGTPANPAVTDKTPNLMIDPAVVSPPPEPIEPSSASPPERQPTDSFAGELERLADLHARGSLDDEQFEAAKTRLLGMN